MKSVPESSSLSRLLILAIAVLGIGALGSARLYPDLLLHAVGCPLRAATGIPCPTCGGTHAAVALAQGRWAAAFAANPLVAAGAIVLALAAIWALGAAVIPRWRRRPVLDAPEQRTARALAVLLVLAAWAYQIWRSGR